MSSAQHLSAIDLLCSREFPAEHGGSAAGYGGPGYLIAPLASGEAAQAPTGRPYTSAAGHDADQCEAERDALALHLARRHGEAHRMSLDGVLLRALDLGEEIPEPWASLSEHVGSIHLWRIAGLGRWLGLGISRQGEEDAPYLLAVVTEIDPP